jgi:hypothetical protein
MTAPDFAHAWRVVCPDGTTGEVFIDERNAGDLARQQAALCDRIHDDARCVGRHRVERATWVEVPR